MMNKVKKILSSPQVQILCRLLLGGLFIYASLGKIVNPEGFARIVYDYRLFPNFTIYFIAFLIPWLEMISGLFLVSGLMVRTPAILLSVLLFSFIVALSINALRGLDISCGCFSTSGEFRESAIISIVRDLIFLIPAGVIVFFHQSKQRTVRRIVSLLRD
jgi:putative oxidoreductase